MDAGPSTDLTKTVGQNASLECHFTGSVSVAGDFSWTGPALADLGERVRTKKTSDLSSTLEIRNVGVMDSGIYTCSHGSPPTKYDVKFNLSVWGELSDLA